MTDGHSEKCIFQPLGCLGSKFSEVWRFMTLIFRYVIVDILNLKNIALLGIKTIYLYIFYSSQKRDWRNVTDGKKFHDTENMKNKQIDF